ncbi:Na+/H+ antiporter family protein [Alkalihalophilus marmarensis]|uniref:Na+/H+ antiporter family protein n=1 Tax=Alkalihalophilus marmarensis TaxID=521377 RepID=UPI002E2130C5|nr:Na+/H+ antiporter NhaC family protein [Alkalihalophilus marmarensis]MED1601966.1 Na+/H+ antiporter NhaC family protein [Alkalihalophilus marmarensis]
MFNAVVISVIVMVVLSLLRVNVVLAILFAALTAGLVSGLGVVSSIDMLISGMGGQASTALSYILLGAFAVMIGHTGTTGFLVRLLINSLKGKKAFMLLAIAGVASLSQNVVPVHIAFIPILIPPLLHLFDKMKLDRRGVATSLTFGLKAPYVMIPAGYGLIFHGIISGEMQANGMDIATSQIPLAMLLPGLGMVAGLLIAIFVTYKKDRVITPNTETDSEIAATYEQENVSFTTKHLFTLIAIIATLIVQLTFESLILGALTGIVLMFAFRVVPFKYGDQFVNDGIKMMGMIAFIMLIASGYATILKETGAVESLVETSSAYLGNSMLLAAILMLFVGMFITMGIGSSFGTIPILAALFVPLCLALGFSPLATAALIGTAGAIGDAGSPASDSTLGPTAGLNADGRHNHIWDTCVPTFIHFNIPLFLFGLAAAMIL